jgi:DNA-binding NarL/FixJ family response regulator
MATITSAFRVLVVEDHEPFRRFVCSMLEERPELQIVCEVSDGQDAVRKAAELHPDLILLDVGLPSLNGFEAARQIRKLSHKSKILFVSQESSADVVQEAFRIGALGCVVKVNAGSDLLPVWRRFVRASGLSALDWRVTFPPSLSIGKFPSMSTNVRCSDRHWRPGTNSLFERSFPVVRVKSLPAHSVVHSQ